MLTYTQASVVFFMLNSRRISLYIKESFFFFLFFRSVHHHNFILFFDIIYYCCCCWCFCFSMSNLRRRRKNILFCYIFHYFFSLVKFRFCSFHIFLFEGWSDGDEGMVEWVYRQTEVIEFCGLSKRCFQALSGTTVALFFVSKEDKTLPENFRQVLFIKILVNSQEFLQLISSLIS